MPFSVYPTGTTIYNPAQCWNGYTVYQLRDAGAIVVNMNGKTVKRWHKLKGFPTANKIMPGGYIMGSTALRSPKHGFQDGVDLVQMDWDGRIVWQFNKYDLVKDPHYKARWMARHHHDYQREGSSVGYYSPHEEPLTKNGNTIILCHKNTYNTAISEKWLLDDAFVEVNWDGEIIWEWGVSDHYNDLGFSEVAKNTLAQNPNMVQAGEGMGDWMHINSCSLLGPNKWFDAGDSRFNPENVIFSSRESNILAVVEKKSGNIIWKVGPEYVETESLRNLGQIVGPHHFHMIPKGLPGEGNMMVYDNGGWAGYGAPNPGSATGRQNALRDYSRILEFDPNTLEIIWQYPPTVLGPSALAVRYSSFSPLMSSAQRLLNGNTLITEGNSARIYEVTTKGEVAWEFVNPHQPQDAVFRGIYRAYRVPYEWIPQLEQSEEKPVLRPDNSKFRVPRSVQPMKTITRNFTQKKGTQADLCATPQEG